MTDTVLEARADERGPVAPLCWAAVVLDAG